MKAKTNWRLGSELFAHWPAEDFPRRLYLRLALLYRRLIGGYHPEKRYMRGRNSR